MPPTPTPWQPAGEPAPRWYMLVYTRPPDGEISEMGNSLTYDTPAEEYEAFEKIAQGKVKPGQHYEIIGINDYTAQTARVGSSYFRNAFRWQPGSASRQASGLTVHMPMARAIFRHHIRQERDPLLNALDVEYYKALETGADTTDIVARKEELRNLPQDPAIEAANTPQELFDAWPTELLGERSTEGRGRPGRGYYESPGTY